MNSAGRLTSIDGTEVLARRGSGARCDLRGDLLTAATRFSVPVRGRCRRGAYGPRVDLCGRDVGAGDQRGRDTGGRPDGRVGLDPFSGDAEHDHLRVGTPFGVQQVKAVGRDIEAGALGERAVAIR